MKKKIKMKTKEMIQRLSLFLLALVLTMPTWAQGGSGNESETITIASKADWKTFCDRVNKGQTTLNAKLTKDVDLGEEIVMAGTADSYYYNFFYYTGTFDGQGHTLKFNWNAGKDDKIAPFKYVKDATIKNLRTQGKITTKGDGLSGMVYAAFGTTTISGCISDVDITGGDGGWYASQAAGMVQVVTSGASVHITDCLVKGSITDNADESERAMAGFVFSNNGTYTLTRCLYVGKNNAPNDSYTFGTEKGISATFTDCYYLNTCGKAQGKQVTAEQLKSGYVAYKLQKGRESQVWGQTLGTDNEPQLTADATKRVYEVKFVYNGEVKATRYANSGKTVALPTAEELLGAGYNPKMTYMLNFGDFTANTPVTEDKSVDVTVTGTFNIASKEDWKAFCDIVGSGQNAVDAKMTADVDLGGDIVMVGAGGHNYSGTFDGQNHTLKINWNSGSETRIAPFYSVDGATIRNLRTEGYIKSITYGLSGLIYSVDGATTISGCVSAVNITSSYNEGGCAAAGMIERVRDNAKVTITDCVVKGKFTATTENGKRYMAGFVCNQYGTCTLTNCLYVGESNGTGGNTHTFGYKTTLNNCYYLNACGEAQGERIVEKQLESGEVTYKLQNGRDTQFWGQTLGSDKEPLLTADEAKHIYKVDFTYNNEVKATRYATRNNAIYSGMPTFTAKDLMGSEYNEHHFYTIAFEGGFNASTTVTADRQVAVSITEKDCYEIATKEDWRAFRELVNEGQTAVDAKLTQDVNLGEEILMLGYRLPNVYSGTFDGQGHTLSFSWDAGSRNEIAPFKNVKDATIRNLRTQGKITSSGYDSQLSGLINYAYGNTTISGCVSEVDLKGRESLAGILQWPDDTAHITINDCLVKGNFHATSDQNGGTNIAISGFVAHRHQDAACTLNNCLYLGTNNASPKPINNVFSSFTFCSDFELNEGTGFTRINNCYYLNACGKAQGERIVEKQLKSGEVTKKLQGDRTDKCYWAQQLGEMPDFYNAADKSKANYVYYDAAKKGWACDDFRLTDGQPLPIGLDFTAANVTYERNFNGTQNATLCLPYDLSAQGFKAYTLSGGNKNEVHFKEVDDKLTAYTPYYITANGMPQLGGRNIEVKAYKADKMTTPAAGYKFTGTVAGVSNATAAADNAYILQDDGKFHKVTTTNSAATIPAYRAYIICPPQASGAKQLSVVLDGETTGIGSTTNEATDGAADGAVYDLQGRRVADRLDDSVRRQIPTGVYIVNGRKVIVK